MDFITFKECIKKCGASTYLVQESQFNIAYWSAFALRGCLKFHEKESAR